MVGRPNVRSERGQSLVMFAIFLPVIALFFSFVVDGGHAFLEKRSAQNAADASALAAVQELGGFFAGTCDTACTEDKVRATATEYSLMNGGPVIEGRCADGYDNCFTWPYKGSDGLVEVKLRSLKFDYWFGTRLVEALFDDPVGVFDDFTAPARAVASYTAVTETTCTLFASEEPTNCPGPGSQCDTTATSTPDGDPRCLDQPAVPPQQGLLDVGEEAHCVFAENQDEDPSNDIEDPDQYLGTSPPCTIVDPGEGDGVEGAQGFAMSRRCDAILYTGTPSTANRPFDPLGAFATNGGLNFQGKAGKRIDTLGFDKARCGLPELPEPPNGDPAACDAAATARNQPESCVRNLVDFGDRLPLNWPVTPPIPPTPLLDGSGNPLPASAWDPTVHYPRFCILLTPPAGSNVVTLAVVPGPPGVYCVSGPDTVLVIVNDMTAGDGYTFFGLDGARIEVNSNGTDVRFYWPSSCPSPDTGVVGERPTTRDLSFVCWDRRIVGYDPLTLMYSSQSTPFPALCEEAAICIRGQDGAIEGDIFAPEPRALAPPSSLTMGGGTVWIAGGGAAAGNGFIESWLITIQGNSATYTGTGPLVGSTGTVVTQGTLELGGDATCFFNPPVPNPEDYVDSDPPCFFPGTPATYFPIIELGPEWYREDTAIVGADIGMDE